MSFGYHTLNFFVNLNVIYIPLSDWQRETQMTEKPLKHIRRLKIRDTLNVIFDVYFLYSKLNIS